jgi:hypothetical protein
MPVRTAAAVLLMLALAPAALAARCTGAADCTACKTCGSCAYCSDGGTCGVKQRQGGTAGAQGLRRASDAEGGRWRQYLPSLAWFGAAAGGAIVGGAVAARVLGGTVGRRRRQPGAGSSGHGEESCRSVGEAAGKPGGMVGRRHYLPESGLWPPGAPLVR